MSIKNSISMGKCLFVLGLSLVICACNGSGSTQPSSTSNNNDHLVDPAAAGNGVWNYSVATDYYYGTQNPVESPSLKYDITVAHPTSTIQFVFPVFSTLDAPNGVIATPVESSYFVTICPSNEKPLLTQMLNYYALPQLNDSYLSTATILGTCVNGESVTAYYSGFTSHVVPVIEITAELGAALGSASAETVAAVADNVAAIINNDPNTYGVAFDNEPLLSKEGGNSTTSAGTVMEQNFYGELAYQLALHKRYLFLFDATSTANYLYANGYNHSNLNNIVIAQNLYDLDTTDESKSAGPVSVANYTTLVDNEASKDLSSSLSANPPLRFMLPASATSTMWDYLQGYNMVATGNNYIAPTTLTDSSLCAQVNATTMGTIDNSALSAFLCSPSNPIDANPPNGECPGVPGVEAESIIIGFLNSQNCVNYTNSDHMEEYFNASLSSISNSDAFSNKRYLGADLYAWRISAYSDINASKGYFNQNYDSKSYESSTQLFPPEITGVVWESFINWSIIND